MTTAPPRSASRMALTAVLAGMALLANVPAAHAWGDAAADPNASGSVMAAGADPGAAADASTRHDRSPDVADGGREALAPEWVLDLLRAVQGHPSLRAAASSVRAAELQLEGARQPFELEVNASYTRLAVEGDHADLVEQPAPQVGIQAIAHPFRFGDLADLEVQRQAEVARARLALREATAQLQAQALDAASGLMVARAGVALAERGLELGRSSLEATMERERRGAALATDVERARQEVVRSEHQLAGARDRVQLARRSLHSLTNGADIMIPDAAPPEVGVADDAPPAVIRAELDVALARVGLSAAERNLYPVAQASYTWNLEEDKGSLTLALESRTLSPTLTYRTSSGGTGGTAAGAGASALADLPPMQQMPEPPAPDPPRVAGRFNIGASVTLSPERFRAADAARARVQAAEAALHAAIERAELTRSSLWTALEAATRQLGLAEREVELARVDVRDAARRVELGLATEIELGQRELAVAQAELTLLQARADLLRAQLDTYTNAAIPLSEVLE